MEAMDENKYSDVEVFVHDKMVVAFVCPQCRLERSISVDKIKDVSHWNVNASCRKCGHKFKVSFNFRKYYRKETHLRGFLFASLDAQELVGDILVTDVALTGMGFVSTDYACRVGSVMLVRFFLDDQDNTEIEKLIRIESVRDTKIGAIFVGTKDFDKTLGKYILPK